MSRQFINAAVKNDIGKIELWGYVYEDVPTDFWTGEKVEGEFITYAKFKDAMESVKDCKTVELHLNSFGGDATVGITIANLIKSSKQHIIGVNDGVCASAGMTILSACDEVRTHKSSLFMIHQTMGLCIGFYNNEELAKVMDCNSTYDSAAAEIYASRTGLSKNQCLNMMKKTTWMDGIEALEKGFADSLVPEEEEENSSVELVNKSTMRINGIEQNIDMFNLSDDFVEHVRNKTANIGGKDMGKQQEDLKDKLFNSIASIFQSNSAEEDEEDEENKGVNVNESQDEEDENEKENSLKNDLPEVTEEEIENRVNSAVAAERQRIQSIRKIADGIDADLVNEAMFGETACDAGELALRAMAREKNKQQEALNKLEKDNENSQVNEISNEPGEEPAEEGNSEKDFEAAAKRLQAKVKQIKEGK